MKNLTKITYLVRVVCIAWALSCLSFGQGPSAPFSISISAPQVVKIGSVAKINIMFKNVSKQPISFGFFSDPTDAKLMFAFDVHGSDGGRPAETAYMMDKPLEGHFGQLDLKPGETLQMGADLSKLFDLRSGTYTIQLSRGQNDYIPLVGRRGDSDLLKPGEAQSAQSQPPVPPPVIVKSNQIKLTVVP